MPLLEFLKHKLPFMVVQSFFMSGMISLAMQFHMAGFDRFSPESWVSSWGFSWIVAFFAGAIATPVATNVANWISNSANGTGA